MPAERSLLPFETDYDWAEYSFSHLDMLEAESIYIVREVAAEFARVTGNFRKKHWLRRRFWTLPLNRALMWI
jgi:hypothetical protein